MDPSLSKSPESKRQNQGKHKRPNKERISEESSHLKAPQCFYDNILILDFETTSNDGITFDYPFEIIQFAVTPIFGPGPNWRTDDSKNFNKFVRPVILPTLTDFCKFFTGISQEDVDKADLFVDVYGEFRQWLKDIGVENSFLIATDGRNDMWRIAQYQFILCGLQMPVYFKRFVSIFKIFESRATKQRTAGYIRNKSDIVAETAGEDDRANQSLDSSSLNESLNSTLDSVNSTDEIESTKMLSIDVMCDHYNIERGSNRHNALSDVLYLREIVEIMLKCNIRFYINNQLVCVSSLRQKKLNLPENWRQNFSYIMKVSDRVLPLFNRLLPVNKSTVDYETCAKCKKPLEECGIDGIHKEFPAHLFGPNAPTYGEISFAVAAGLDKEQVPAPISYEEFRRRQNK